MYGIYFRYKNGDKDYLIEKFKTKDEAIEAKEKYVVSEGEKVKVKLIS